MHQETIESKVPETARRAPILAHRVEATWRRRAATSMSAGLPSGKVPTTLVRRRISRISRSNGRGSKRYLQMDRLAEVVDIA